MSYCQLLSLKNNYSPLITGLLHSSHYCKILDLTQVHFLVKCEDYPIYAYKGSTTDRNAALLAIIQLECPDC